MEPAFGRRSSMGPQVISIIKNSSNVQAAANNAIVFRIAIFR